HCSEDLFETVAATSTATEAGGGGGGGGGGGPFGRKTAFSGVATAAAAAGCSSWLAELLQVKVALFSSPAQRVNKRKCVRRRVSARENLANVVLGQKVSLHCPLATVQPHYPVLN